MNASAHTISTRATTAHEPLVTHFMRTLFRCALHCMPRPDVQAAVLMAPTVQVSCVRWHPPTRPLIPTASLAARSALRVGVVVVLPDSARVPHKHGMSPLDHFANAKTDLCARN